MTQNDTNSANEILDQRMAVAAECLANPAFQGTKEQIAQAAGVSCSTLYRWLRNDDFIKIVNNLIEKYSNAELGMVWKALARECSSGNVQAMKLYFEARGRAQQQEEHRLHMELLKAQVEKTQAEVTKLQNGNGHAEEKSNTELANALIRASKEVSGND